MFGQDDDLGMLREMVRYENGRYIVTSELSPAIASIARVVSYEIRTTKYVLAIWFEITKNTYLYHICALVLKIILGLFRDIT